MSLSMRRDFPITKTWIYLCWCYVSLLGWAHKIKDNLITLQMFLDHWPFSCGILFYFIVPKELTLWFQISMYRVPLQISMYRVPYLDYFRRSISSKDWSIWSIWNARGLKDIFSPFSLQLLQEKICLWCCHLDNSFSSLWNFTSQNPHKKRHLLLTLGWNGRTVQIKKLNKHSWFTPKTSAWKTSGAKSILNPTHSPDQRVSGKSWWTTHIFRLMHINFTKNHHFVPIWLKLDTI